MPEFFIFLLKINISLLIFCLAYYLVLRRLTFYTLNRFFLIGGIIFSTLYPFIDLSALFKNAGHTIKPIYITTISAAAQGSAGIDYWLCINLIFWTGVVIMAIKMGLSLYALRKIHKKSIPSISSGYRVRLLSGNMNTFSFWKNIYLNPSHHNKQELKDVLEHEQVHVKELHTFDILLAEVATILYWFNPGVWLMRKAVKENVEFITDQKILSQGADRKAYQYSMLHSSAGVSPSVLMNNFNITGIKRRIIMMNSKKSSLLQLTRYVFLLPVIAILCMAFSFIKKEVKSNTSFISPTHFFKQIKKAELTLPPEKSISLPTLKTRKKHTLSSVKTETLPDTSHPAPVVEKYNYIFNTDDKVSKDSTGLAGKKVTKIIMVRATGERPSSTSKQAITAVNNAAFAGTGTILSKSDTPPTIYINGKETSAEDLKRVNVSDITAIRIGKNPGDSVKKSVFIIKVMPKN